MKRKHDYEFRSLIERYSHIKQSIDESYSPYIDEFILHLNKINSIDFIKSKLGNCTIDG